MGVVVSGSGSSDPDVDLILRIEEDFYGTNPWTGVSATPRQTNKGSRYESINNLNFMGGTVLGTLAGGLTGFEGRRIAQGSSDGASVRFRRGGNTTVPLSQRFATVNSQGLNRQLKSYLVQVPMRLTAQPAGSRWEFCLCGGDSGVIVSGNLTGASWGADMAVNGGRWTPRLRLVNAGAITAGTDSGISPTGTTFRRMGIRYIEGPSPRIEWLIDGSVLFSVAGDANMPTYDGATLEPGYLPFYGWSIVAGGVAQMGNGLYEVRRVG